MSVQLVNESLPSFEPIEQKQQQKRKRVSSSLKESNGDNQPITKKSRGKV
jgi:hypothetical protein